MSNYVSEIMSRDLTMVSVDTSVARAEQQMLKRNRRCVPVVDDQRNIFGVLGYSDIVKHRQNQGNLRSTKVWEICSHIVFSVAPMATLETVVDVMVENSVHHVLVLEGKVRGIVSIMDLLQLYRSKLVSPDAREEATADSPQAITGTDGIYRL
ncbi:MAG: CBS domain-containing protein [Pseudomonadales bacterium]|jgi:CBS-domain-containing membrane protein|nr:CBS domain-containing protein [Pseudomonadales bacterium]MDB3909095.1 CBS domain-containing protein [Gammaproteobacteria bacterium]